MTQPSDAATTDSVTPSRFRKIFRILILLSGGLEAVLGLGFSAMFLTGSSNPLGSSIAQGIATLIAVPLLVCVLPALLLAWRDRVLPLAAVLSLAAPALCYYLMATA